MRILLPILALLLCAVPARATLNVVQVRTNLANAATAVTVSITSTTGNGLWAFCGENNNNTSTVTMSDTATNTYTQQGSYSSVNAGQRAGAFYNANATGVTSVTCTWSGSLSTRVTMTVYEISGQATSSPEDGNTTASVANGTSVASGNITTTHADDILLYAVHNITGGGDAATNSFTFPTNGIGTRVDVSCRIVSSTGTYSTTTSWNTSGSADGNFVAIKSAAAGGTGSCAWGGTTITSPSKASKLERLDEGRK